MTRHRMFPLITIATLLALLLQGLGCDHHPSTQVTVTANTAPPALVAPADLDLQTIVGMLQSGAADGPALEQAINSPDSGINNVDTDKDGKIDYIQVVEAPIPAGKKMELVAHASSGAIPDTTVAAIRFDTTGPAVDVQAGFSPVIDPGGSYYYHSTLASDLLFARWLLMPSRPLFIAPMPAPGFVYRSRVSPALVTQQRSTFSSTTRVAPVQAQPRPPTFNAGRLTGSGSSPAAAAPRQPATTLGGASNGVSDFKATGAGPKPAGIGFGSGGGSTPTPRAAPAPAPVSRPSSPAPSRPSSSLSSGRKR